PSKLVFNSQPLNTVAGQLLGGAGGIAVAVMDNLGNVVTSDRSTVTIALSANPTGDSLGSTLTAPVVNGVAVFKALTLTRAGTGYTLKVSDGSLAGATSNAFAITPAPASRLTISSLPASTSAGQPLGGSAGVLVSA